MTKTGTANREELAALLPTHRRRPTPSSNPFVPRHFDVQMIMETRMGCPPSDDRTRGQLRHRSATAIGRLADIS